MWNSIKLLVTDFDGIHTDAYVYLTQDGNEMVRCSRRDSLGIEMLRMRGVDTCVISKETNPVVSVRCRKLGIDYYQGVASGDGKREILTRIAAEKGIPLEQVAYMGDDVNDLSALEAAGVAITVADGHEHLKAIADYVTTVPGGQHAIREVAELIINATNIV